MEIISGFEGDAESFIKKAIEIWKKEGAKAKGAKERYQIIIGTKNQRATLVPTVSTRAGTEVLIAWNLTQDDIKKIKEEAQGAELPVSTRLYLWFGEAPAILPNEVRKTP